MKEEQINNHVITHEYGILGVQVPQPKANKLSGSEIRQGTKDLPTKTGVDHC